MNSVSRMFAEMGCTANELTDRLKQLQRAMAQQEINSRLVARMHTDIPLEAIRKTKSTNCPNCGAPVDILAEKCAYCDTPYI